MLDATVICCVTRSRLSLQSRDDNVGVEDGYLSYPKVLIMEFVTIAGERKQYFAASSVIMCCQLPDANL